MRNLAAGQVIDVTAVVGSALPELLLGRTEARIFLVADEELPAPMQSVPPALADKGGLAPGVLRRVREHIERHLAAPIQLHDLAQIAGLSDCHFARAFKQSAGTPPHRYLVLQRVERARELIRRSNRPMADIALEVGFSDQSHFTRSFAAATGLTPRAFRQRHR